MAPDDPGAMRPSSEDTAPVATEKRDGLASGLTCPDCHGSIWELPEGHLVRFECRVGHRYNPEVFLGAQSVRVEDALWTAINVLSERTATLRQFAERFAGRGALSADYAVRARETEQQAEVIRTLLASLVRSVDSDATDPA